MSTLQKEKKIDIMEQPPHFDTRAAYFNTQLIKNLREESPQDLLKEYPTLESQKLFVYTVLSQPQYHIQNLISFIENSPFHADHELVDIYKHLLETKKKRRLELGLDQNIREVLVLKRDRNPYDYHLNHRERYN